MAAAAQKIVAGTQKLTGILVNLGTEYYTRFRPYAIKWASHAKSEYSPPNPAEFGQIASEATVLVRDKILRGGFMDATFMQVGVAGMCVAEVGLIFCAGEVVGRGSLIGYKTSEGKTFEELYDERNGN